MLRAWFDTGSSASVHPNDNLVRQPRRLTGLPRAPGDSRTVPVRQAPWSASSLPCSAHGIESSALRDIQGAVVGISWVAHGRGFQPASSATARAPSPGLSLAEESSSQRCLVPLQVVL